MILDASIVNVAMPSIGGALDFSQQSLAWVARAFQGRGAALREPRGAVAARHRTIGWWSAQQLGGALGAMIALVTLGRVRRRRAQRARRSETASTEGVAQAAA